MNENEEVHARWSSTAEPEKPAVRRKRSAFPLIILGTILAFVGILIQVIEAIPAVELIEDMLLQTKAKDGLVYYPVGHVILFVFTLGRIISVSLMMGGALVLCVGVCKAVVCRTKSPIEAETVDEITKADN